MSTDVCIQRWIAEARGGSRAALDRLLAACCPYLLAVANRELSAVLRSRLDPEDVVQDTLMKAWQHFAHFRGESEAELLAWLRQILRRNLANERREHVQTAMRSVQREVSWTEAAVTREPEEQAQEQERQAALQIALQRLPAHYRQALDLHTQQERTFAQIGERLRCSAEAARKLWRRAAQSLVRLLGEAWKF